MGRTTEEASFVHGRDKSFLSSPKTSRSAEISNQHLIRWVQVEGIFPRGEETIA